MKANRRKEIFRAARGSKLSGLRGRVSSEQNAAISPGSRPDLVYGEEPRIKRRVKLDPRIEDELTDPDVRESRGYSEPND